MATMPRNINLEEVGTDALFGIEYLNHQTILQKIFFFGGIALGIIWNIVGNFFLHCNVALIILGTLICIFFGVILGCNFNQDLTLIQYFKLIFFHSETIYVSKPTEELKQIKQANAKMIKEKELREKQQQSVSAEEQHKFLIKVLAVVGIVFLLFVLIVILLLNGQQEDVHHIVNTASQLQ